MKEKLVKGARKVLPQGSVRKLEDSYRKARVKAVSARYGYPARGLKVIAVTGTNGKTTTINYINSIMKVAGHKTAMFSTALIEIDGVERANDLNRTVPLTVELYEFFRDAKKAKVDYVVLEITSHALHQHKLDGVPIEAAIMTNLTQDHLDYHKTMEEYAAAKALLFKGNPRYIVLNHDDAWFEYYDQFDAGEQKMTYGEHENAEARIVRTKLYKKGSEADVTFDHQTKLELATHLPGKFNISNMTAAATIAYLLGVSVNDIISGVADLEAVPGRFEHVDTGDKGYEVVVDYAHTPDALEKLLETAQSITKNRVILVFGATGDRDKGKRPVMGEIAARLADRIIVTDEESYSEEPRGIREAIIEGIEKVGAGGKMTEIADRREAIAKALSIATNGDMILVTGMGHEQFRIINGKKEPWNDAAVVKEIISQKTSRT
ncbi:UDP-N-acetylmuramoyl-L-alanyl-D-glutamate--2,6-diaminopimelate ligase [Candidatus Saccharibacteria bacterium]|nr:UDP-N-acetylmuramoyl-L-alanyl-D-glutamate--2,6-diaminopimelate ligase [Candidatus Saccharibacteria bacterium]